jgi:hypothetical protein
MTLEPAEGKEEMNHYMDFEPHFITECNEQICREVNSLRLAEQLQKNRKPHVWQLASTITSVSRRDLGAKLSALDPDCRHGDLVSQPKEEH